jgi:hypothetical protein
LFFVIQATALAPSASVARPVGSLVQGSTLPSSGFTLRNTAFAPDAGTINQITSFATDGAGNLYITDLGGEVFRVQPSASPNFAGDRLSVEIMEGEVPAEDRLGSGIGDSNGTVTGRLGNCPQSSRPTLGPRRGALPCLSANPQALHKSRDCAGETFP